MYIRQNVGPPTKVIHCKVSQSGIIDIVSNFNIKKRNRSPCKADINIYKREEKITSSEHTHTMDKKQKRPPQIADTKYENDSNTRQYMSLLSVYLEYPLLLKLDDHRSLFQ